MKGQTDSFASFCKSIGVLHEVRNSQARRIQYATHKVIACCGGSEWISVHFALIRLATEDFDVGTEFCTECETRKHAVYSTPHTKS